jgi:hypothetical protein
MPLSIDDLDLRDDRDLFDLDEDLEIEDDTELARRSFRIAGDETDEEELAELDLLGALEDDALDHFDHPDA